MRSVTMFRRVTVAAGLGVVGRGLGAVGFAVATANCGGDPGSSRRAPDTNAFAVASDIGRADAKVTELELESRRLLAEIRAMEESNRVERHVVYHNLACVYRQCGRFSESESAFLEALRLDPSAPDTHLGLGLLYDADLRQTEKARACFERFLELSPDSPRAAEVRTRIGTLKKQIQETGATR